MSYTLIQYPFSCKTYTRKTQGSSWPLITLLIPGCIPVLPTPRQGTNTHPTGSLEDLTKEARSLLAASLANSSKLAYRRTWQMLLQRFPEVSCLPLSPAILCNFIAHRFCTHISAVSYVRKILGLQIRQIHFCYERFYKVAITRLLTRTLVFQLLPQFYLG